MPTLVQKVIPLTRRVLNVGGGPGRSLPNRFSGWHQDLLDIDPDVKPDICCDALQMQTLPSGEYDAVYCSHSLEHFYRHDVAKVLAGFRHVLKEDGFADVAVPNLGFLIKEAATREIDDIWYHSPAGPISFHDVLYGHGRYMERGNLYYAHKCGFTKNALAGDLFAAGFSHVSVIEQESNLMAFAFLREPQPWQLETIRN